MTDSWETLPDFTGDEYFDFDSFPDESLPIEAVPSADDEVEVQPNLDVAASLRLEIETLERQRKQKLAELEQLNTNIATQPIDPPHPEQQSQPQNHEVTALSPEHQAPLVRPFISPAPILHEKTFAYFSGDAFEYYDQNVIDLKSSTMSTSIPSQNMVDQSLFDQAIPSPSALQSTGPEQLQLHGQHLMYQHSTYITSASSLANGPPWPAVTVREPEKSSARHPTPTTDPDFHTSPGARNLGPKRARYSDKPEVEECLGHQVGILSRQLNKAGVPGSWGSIFCANPDEPPTRRQRCDYKRNSKGQSCYLCLYIFKKKCDGQKPCKRCLEFWRKRTSDSTAFTWTCHYIQSLTEFNCFIPGHRSSKVNPVSLRRRGEEVLLMYLSEQHFGIFHLLYAVAPLLAMVMVLRTEYPLSTWIPFGHVNSLLREMNVLGYLMPELQTVVPVLERLREVASTYLLDTCFPPARISGPAALVNYVNLWNEVNELEQQPGHDEKLSGPLRSAAEKLIHLESARTFNVPTQGEDIGFLAAFLDGHDEFRSLRSLAHFPRYQFTYPQHAILADVKTSESTPGCPPCRYACSGVTGVSGARPQNQSCACNWVSESIPSGLLSFFRYSRQSLAHQLHQGELYVDQAGKIELVHCDPSMNHVSGCDHLTELHWSRFFILYLAFRAAMTATFAILRLALLDSSQCSNGGALPRLRGEVPDGRDEPCLQNIYSDHASVLPGEAKPGASDEHLIHQRTPLVLALCWALQMVRRSYDSVFPSDVDETMHDEGLRKCDNFINEHMWDNVPDRLSASLLAWSAGHDKNRPTDPFVQLELECISGLFKDPPEDPRDKFSLFDANGDAEKAEKLQESKERVDKYAKMLEEWVS